MHIVKIMVEKFLNIWQNLCLSSSGKVQELFQHNLDSVDRLCDQKKNKSLMFQQQASHMPTLNIFIHFTIKVILSSVNNQYTWKILSRYISESDSEFDH